jgi:hypothetical protein
MIDSSSVNKKLQYYFTVGSEFHIPYFDHMKRMHPSFKKMNPIYSGISHHMLFSRQYVKEMMQMVEDHHRNKDKDGNYVFWRIFIECVKEHLQYPAENVESGASEYEMYFNFMLQYHNDLVWIRSLKWHNVSSNFDIDNYNGGDLDYVSICWYS